MLFCVYAAAAAFVVVASLKSPHHICWLDSSFVSLNAFWAISWQQNDKHIKLLSATTSSILVSSSTSK